jgi:hypothetical protein
MASFFTSAKKRALVRCDMTEFDDEVPADPRHTAGENQRLLDRFLTQKIGVESVIAKRLVSASTRGAWHYDSAASEAMTRARAREAPEAQLDPTDPLKVIKAKSDHTDKIPKMPFDFFVGQPPFRAILVGATMSGKTTLQQYLLEHHYGPYFKRTGGGILYISQTAKTDEVMHNPALRRYMVRYDGTPLEPDDEPYTTLDETKMRKLRDIQEQKCKEVGKGRAPHILVTINDFASSTATMKSELLDELAMLWRHFNVSVLVDAQQLVRLSTVMRTNFQLAWLFDAVGYEMEHYEDQARVRLMKDRSAFRDMFQYALEPPPEELAELIQKADEAGELLPRAARTYNFLTINRQANPRFWYRRNLDTLLEVADSGWLAPPHDIAHAFNPRWQRAIEQDLRHEDREQEGGKKKKQKLPKSKEKKVVT